MSLFRRKWSVTLGDLKVTDLRVQFRVTKTLEKEPNTLDLKISNLSEASRGKLTKKSLTATLEAGYEGTVGIIFSGDSRTIDNTRDHVEWVTHVQCGDGEAAYRHARVNESFGPNTSFKDVIKKAASSLGLNTGNLDDVLKQNLSVQTFKHGVALFGSASEKFDKLVKSIGYTWSIQQGALQLTKPGEPPAPTTAILLSPSTGLIGSPDHAPPDKKKKPSQLKVKCLLNPKIRPGSIIVVDSAGVKRSEFIVQHLTHSGDSHGSMWVTEIEAQARPNQ